MVKLPSSNDNLDTDFEYESEITKDELIEFLQELTDQLRTENEITVSMVGTKAKFPFKEPINLEIETDYNERLQSRELEVEIEFRENQSRSAG